MWHACLYSGTTLPTHSNLNITSKRFYILSVGITQLQVTPSAPILHINTYLIYRQSVQRRRLIRDCTVCQCKTFNDKYCYNKIKFVSRSRRKINNKWRPTRSWIANVTLRHKEKKLLSSRSFAALEYRRQTKNFTFIRF